MSLWQHQLEALGFIESRNYKAGLFMDMRTGKTRVALHAAARALARRTMIVCPLTVIGVWEREIRAVAPNAHILDLTRCGTVRERAAALRAFDNGIVLVNYESYWRPPLREAILRWAPQAVILDEAQAIKSRTTHQSKFAHKLADLASTRVRLALTGTPVANGLHDLWSIYRFIDQRAFGRWTDFERRYIVKGGYMGYAIVGYQNEQEAHDIVARTSFQYNRPTPAPPPTVVPVRLEPETRRVYDELKKDSIASLDGDERVIARTALTAILRLQQVTGGFVTSETGIVTDLSEEKPETTAELVRQASSSGLRVVVFARFLKDLDKLEKALKEFKPARIDGSVPAHQRTKIIADLQAGRLDVLIAQIRTASVGIDLSGANICIFHSTGFSLTDFLQARDRLQGPNQKGSVGYYLLQAERSVDEKVAEALLAKTDIAHRVTDLNYALDFFDG